MFGGYLRISHALSHAQPVLLNCVLLCHRSALGPTRHPQVLWTNALYLQGLSPKSLSPKSLSDKGCQRQIDGEPWSTRCGLST